MNCSTLGSDVGPERDLQFSLQATALPPSQQNCPFARLATPGECSNWPFVFLKVAKVAKMANIIGHLACGETKGGTRTDY
jgi:hypothetical protein